MESGFCHLITCLGDASIPLCLMIAGSFSLLCDILITTMCFSNPVVGGHLNDFQFGVIINGAAMSILIHACWVRMDAFLSGMRLGLQGIDMVS